MALFKYLLSLEEKNRYSFYLAVFRIFVCFHLIKTILFQWAYLDILYGANSFVSPVPTFITELLGIPTHFLREHYQWFITAYLLIIVLYLFGIGKHFTALLLFLCYETLQRMCNLVLNGGDNLMKFIMLYMVFADSYQYFSIKAGQFRNQTLRRLSNLGSNLCVRAITLHFCMIYFWSAWHKIHAEVWFNGVATYYTFSIGRFKGTPWNDFLARNGVFVTISTYFTLIVEVYFPVLVWFKKTRLVVVLCGIALHLGIYVFMMIYGFEIIFIMTYGFFFKDEEWQAFLNKLISRINRKAKWKLPTFAEFHPEPQVYAGR
ncbi:HTTM domain-containing protein [Chitinophaga sp. GbtcB8]|uniref:HTTM domain-containing protein n=1 Tax=Chitinophaga sp. GbtcB8 TaxID=2824753 RepID=UPI001C30B7A9|nr:HTTM domain-containing protein [Chitinophaga sp. GbtcB8]